MYRSFLPYLVSWAVTILFYILASTGFVDEIFFYFSLLVVFITSFFAEPHSKDWATAKIFSPIILLSGVTLLQPCSHGGCGFVILLALPVMALYGALTAGYTAYLRGSGVVHGLIIGTIVFVIIFTLLFLLLFLMAVINS